MYKSKKDLSGLSPEEANLRQEEDSLVVDVDSKYGGNIFPYKYGKQITMDKENKQHTTYVHPAIQDWKFNSDPNELPILGMVIALIIVAIALVGGAVLLIMYLSNYAESENMQILSDLRKPKTSSYSHWN